MVSLGKINKMLRHGKKLLLILFLLAAGCRPEGERPDAETVVPTQTAEAVIVAAATDSANPDPPAVEIPQDFTLTIWHPFSGELAGLFSTFADEFNEDNPAGTTILIEGHGDEDVLAADIIDAHLNGEPLPNLVIAPSYLLKTWYGSDLPIISEGEFPTDGVADDGWFSGIFPAFWNRDLIEGERIAFPIYQTGNFLFYNQSFARELGFENTPANQAEFREQACRAAQNNLFDDTADNNGTGGWIYDDDAEVLAAWMMGGQLKDGVSGGSLLPFASDENFDSLQFILSLYRDDCAWTGKEPIPYEYFSRRYALFYSGSSEEILIQNNFFSGEASSDDWILIPYPGKEDGSIFLINGYSAAVLDSTPEETLAGLAFIRWMFDEDVQVRIIENSGAFPVSNTVFQAVDPDWEGYPVWDPLIGYLPFGKNVSQISNWILAENVLEDIGWQLVQFNVQPEAVELLLQRGDEIIGEYE